MRAIEAIRAITIVVIGWAMMLWLQPWVYSRRLPMISIIDVDFTDWLQDQYRIGVWIVLVSSTLVTVTWLWITSLSSPSGGGVNVQQWRLCWFLLMLVPITGIGFALFLFNKSDDALISLSIFYVFDILWLYWLPTVTSTPRFYRYVPPGSLVVRSFRLFD